MRSTWRRRAARGLKTVAVSAGYIASQPREEFFRHMDAANIHLKGFSERFYKDLCSGRLAAVLETLDYLKHETKVWFEITTLLIPGENDSRAEIEAESAWLINHLGPDLPLQRAAEAAGITLRSGPLNNIETWSFHRRSESGSDRPAVGVCLVQGLLATGAGLPSWIVNVADIDIAMTDAARDLRAIRFPAASADGPASSSPDETP
jgi:hypothetical protein